MTKSTKIRSGFTLTELLVVITVITMLSAISLGGIRAVQQRSNISRTERTIQKIHFLLMEKLEAYQTIRIDVDNPNIPDTIERVGKMYDLLRMEIPDRVNDLRTFPEIYGSAYSSLVNPIALDKKPNAAVRYLRKYNSRNTANEDSSKNCPSAEFLYMIIMSMPNAPEQFAEYEIGDTDGDGLREFVDAWGNPIKFLRWPVGYTPNKGVITDLQPYSHDNTNTANPTMIDDSAVSAPRGLFDPNEVIKFVTKDTTPAYASFAVYPLVYSAGPDGRNRSGKELVEAFNINTGYDPNGTTQYTYPLTQYTFNVNGTDYTYRILNPFVEAFNSDDPPVTAFIGEPEGSGNHYDNITNHMLEFGKGR